ncbi:MAG: peptidylprolyl isomerase [Pyrinomonadaceae bacterium]|nr:peptidylprolyl isomerase [Pyrinomonadaceae bacterium]
MKTNRHSQTLFGVPLPMHGRAASFILAVCLSLVFCAGAALAQKEKPNRTPKNNVTAAATRAAVPDEIMLVIVRGEDERRWGAELASLLGEKRAAVRVRAALAAGRIGDERAVPALSTLMANDKVAMVRAMAAFALGEIETASAADALVFVLRRGDEAPDVRARAVEALGKVVAALPEKEEERRRTLGETILNVLSIEAQPGIKRQRAVVLEALTAILRARPANAGAVVAQFLTDADARVRADAGNTLARLRAKDGGEQLRTMLMGDPDAVARANAARALGAAENKDAFEVLLARSTSDADGRVRVSSLRSLGALKDTRAVAPLIQRGGALLTSYRAARARGVAHPVEINELLEVATALGRILPNTGNARAVEWLRELREAREAIDPETEASFARIAPSIYLRERPLNKLADESVRVWLFADWRRASSIAQGLKEIADITGEAAGNSVIGLQADVQLMLRAMLDDARLPALAAPDALRALAALKPTDLGEVMRKQLSAKDVIVRATVAELLGELPPDEANANALIEALPVAMKDEELNDAALATLDAIGKQKSARANDAIKTALDSTDHLLRRRAVALLKTNEAGDFSSRIATAAPRYADADYMRVLARRNGRVRAVVKTEKGEFTLELLPDDAPLTVDSFVQLARRGFFNGVTFHRVVPNFVIQGGDPRGDGNGGPGYQIRCEINEVEYGRGAVGMALSGKDTGGSQWFVTHSPQPHLDGGYTVFGIVAEKDMQIVDAIARGDKIISITVIEGSHAPSKKKNADEEKKRKQR